MFPTEFMRSRLFTEFKQLAATVCNSPIRQLKDLIDILRYIPILE